MHSPDLTQQNIDKLAELFPTVVTERLDDDGNPIRAIDFDLLRQELSDHVVEGPQERYQLDWPGKRAALFAANAPIAKTLRPVREESVDFDTTKNLFIEGDNLDALKLLQESYLGKVKLIYIDPPYNTGNDYLYDDDFGSTSEEYLERSGQINEDGARLVANTESNGRFHSDWLTMMYPRLKLARNLLSEDGAIFVSIDFNEVHNLKRVMDEVFGEQNFQREIIWRIGWLSGYKTVAANFIRNHDAILFYSRNRDGLRFIKKYIENKDFKPLVKASKEVNAKLAELGLDSTQQKELLQFVNHANRPERYPIEDTWNCNEYDDLNSIAIVSFSGEKISKLLGIDEEFKGQKSVKMLRRILEATTTDDDLVLDFFSGTSSTAHAVMSLNAEDGGSRRHIMVQLPEATEAGSAAYEAGYSTIAALSRKRIDVAGARIAGEHPHRQIDVGYRMLRVDTSNLTEIRLSPDAVEQDQIALYHDSLKVDRSGEDLLFQVLLDWGLELTLPIGSERINGREVFVVDGGALIACFDSAVQPDVVREIASREPLRAVFRDSAFAADADRINAEQIFAEMSPSTDVKVI